MARNDGVGGLKQRRSGQKRYEMAMMEDGGLLEGWKGVIHGLDGLGLAAEVKRSMGPGHGRTAGTWADMDGRGCSGAVYSG